MEEYGTNPVQLSAHRGLVIEATNQDQRRFIFKIPIYKHSCYNLMELMGCSHNLPGVIQYSRYAGVEGTFYYQKVAHDPLSSKEVAKCASHLVSTVFSIIQGLREKRILHRDVRITNICFNKDFNPILIDFDFCCFLGNDTDEDDNSDFKVFVDDLMLHLLQNDSFDEDEVCKDTFLNELSNGEFIEALISDSVLAKSTHTIEDVIREDNN